MTMQRGDREIRDKMEKMKKEIEIQQHRIENAALSIHNSLQSIKSNAQETALNEGKILMLKAQLRAVEDDLVKAISVKTRKEAKKMAISDSISAAKSRIEEAKKTVVDQRTRKDEYAEIMSHLSHAVKEFEEKHEQDTERRGEIQDAISWYNKVLHLRIETGHGIKFIFTNIDIQKPNEEYFFTIRLKNDTYSLLDCHPHVSETKKLIQELNITNGLYNFIRTMRTKFQDLSAAETTIVSMSAPVSSVSNDTGIGSPANKKRLDRKASQGVLSSIQPSRRSPRFMVKK